MEQIREYLNHHTVSSSISMLKNEQETIAKQIQYLQKLQKNVAHRLETIHSALSLPLNEIHLMKIPPRHCHRLPEGYKNRRNGFSDQTAYQPESKPLIHYWKQPNRNHDFSAHAFKRKNAFLSICFPYRRGGRRYHRWRKLPLRHLSWKL